MASGGDTLGSNASTGEPMSGPGPNPATGIATGGGLAGPGSVATAPGGGAAEPEDGLTTTGEPGTDATDASGSSGATPEGGGGATASGGGRAAGGAASGAAGSGGAPVPGAGGAPITGQETGGTPSGGSANGGTAPGSATGSPATADTGPSTGCGSPAGLANGRLSIDVNGSPREYILRLPDDYDANHPYRLIFGWHQLAGSAESIANRGFYGLDGPSEGQAILVAPEGLVGNDRGDRGWWNNGGEDLDFYFALRDRLFSELCVDRERIFSTGFSFGAMFSFALACTPDSLMRAIAPQAGSAFGGCNASTPVAALGFVGVSDSLLSGHRQGMDGLGERNGCSGEPVEMSTSWCDGLGDDNLPCTCVEYQDCDSGYPVISCEYQAGHTFAPNSGDTIWEFFSQF